VEQSVFVYDVLEKSLRLLPYTRADRQSCARKRFAGLFELRGSGRFQGNPVGVRYVRTDRPTITPFTDFFVCRLATQFLANRVFRRRRIREPNDPDDRRLAATISVNFGIAATETLAMPNVTYGDVAYEAYGERVTRTFCK